MGRTCGQRLALVLRWPWAVGAQQGGLLGGGAGLILDCVHRTDLHIVNEVTYTNDCKQCMQEGWPEGGMPASPLTDLSPFELLDCALTFGPHRLQLVGHLLISAFEAL